MSRSTFARASIAWLPVAAAIMLGGCGDDVGGSTSDESSVAGKAKLQLVKSRSYCRRDPVIGNVAVFVALRNRGTADVTDAAILPIRIYYGGRRVTSPIKDTMVDVTVPADGKVHTVWNDYEVGAGELIVECRVKIVADGISDAERRIEVLQ